MALMQWEPFREFISLRDAINRLFDESFVQTTSTGCVPAVDVEEREDEYIIQAALPGLRRDNLQVSIAGSTVTIHGEMEDGSEKKNGHYLLRERHTGSFSRSLTMPTPLEPDRAEAILENGILTLRVPKAEVARPKPIKVKTVG